MSRLRFPLVVAFVAALGACKSFGTDSTPEPDAGLDAAVAPPCPNGALSFGGKGFVNVEPDGELDSPSNLTVEAWLFPDVMIGDGEADIVSHHDAKNSDGYALVVNKGLLTFRIYSGAGADNVAEGSAPLALGEWHHVAGVFEAGIGALTMFVDGKPLPQTIHDKRTADPYTGPLRFGAAARDGFYGFQGIIDEVRVSATVRYKESFKPAYPLADAEDLTIGTWHFGTAPATADVVREASGRFMTSLGGTATAAQYPKAIAAECPTGARP